MAGEIERFIRIQNPEPGRASAGNSAAVWRTIPNCEKVGVLEYSTLVARNEEAGADEKRLVFHVRFVEGVRKGSRVTFLGNHFSVLGVSESKRLVGVELSCAPYVE